MLWGPGALGAAWAAGPAAAAEPAGVGAWRTLLNQDAELARQEALAALGARPGDAVAAFVLARAAEMLHETVGAESLLHALVRECPGAARVGLAQLHLGAGRPDSAATLLADARVRLAAAGDRTGEIFALGMLAWVHVGRSRPEQAIPLFEEALAAVLAPARGEPPAPASLPRELEVWLRLRLGVALFASRRHADATQHYEVAVDLARELGIPEWEAEGHINLSVVARWRMDLDAAMTHRQAALEGYRASGNVAGQARALHYIAAVHMMRGELPQAMRLLREAIATAGRAGEHREAATSQGDLATLNMLLGDFELALRQYEEALRTYQVGVRPGIADRPYDAWAAGMLTNIALVLTDLGRLREAGDYQDRALAAIRRTGNRRDEAGILANLGRCRCLDGDPRRGRTHLRAAIDSARAWATPLTEATALNDLGACQLLAGDLVAADSAYTAAESLSERTGFYRLQGDVLAGRARVARRRGDPEAALALLERAMMLAEGVRARSRGAERIQARAHGRSEQIYAEAVDLIHELSRHRPTEARRAFTLIQRAKARSLLDLLAETETGLRCRADLRFVEREEAILDSIAALLDSRGPAAAEIEMAVARLEDRLSALESEVRAADPRYAAVQYPQPLALEDFQAAVLAPGELYLDYLLGEEASYLCAVTKDSCRLVRLPARARIEELLAELLPLLQDYNLSAGRPEYLAPVLAAASATLLGPVRADCRSAARLIVAPHGATHYLPFEVLCAEDPAGVPPEVGCAGLPYLIKTTDVVYVHAAGALAQRRAPSAYGAPARITRLLAVGNPPPDPSDSGAERAFFGAGAPGRGAAGSAGAEAELAMIREVFEGSEIIDLEGSAATEENLRAAAARGPYDLVHIAAHGVFNERRPRYSGLVLGLGDAGGDDGFLTAGEVFSLELPCRQVVLSACSSGLGESLTGEGLYGLTRAFHYAGAECVIAALWDVPDVATAALMRCFYAGLVRPGGRGGPHALAEAKRQRLREAVRPPTSDPGALDEGHPCFWAAFIASGEAR